MRWRRSPDGTLARVGGRAISLRAVIRSATDDLFPANTQCQTYHVNCVSGLSLKAAALAGLAVRWRNLR
jgi:hypothetical protein